jgi:DNA-3-methyladenine glycosylase I
MFMAIPKVSPEPDAKGIVGEINITSGGVFVEQDSLNRCEWCLDHPLATIYHDNEWGVPVHDDLKHFEFLTLEVMQAGLNWLMILKKRDNLRAVFDGFDYVKISSYKADRVQSMLDNPDIIRSRNKIESVISNARLFMELQKEFGSFDRYLWGYVNNKTIDHGLTELSAVPASNELSDQISRDLKKRGFKFLGSITVYAHLQAAGLINDHLVSCYRHEQLRA